MCCGDYFCTIERKWEEEKAEKIKLHSIGQIVASLAQGLLSGENVLTIAVWPQQNLRLAT